MSKIKEPKEVPSGTFKTITVKWADHWVDNGDHSLGDVVEEAKPMYGNYTGFLVHDGKQVLILCSNYWDEKEEGQIIVSDPMYIMKRSIVYRSDRDAKA